MSRTTLERDKKVKSVLKLTEALSSDLHNHLFSRDVFSKKSFDVYFKQFQTIRSKVTTLYEDFLFDTEGLGKIEKEIFFSVEHLTGNEVSILSTYVNKLQSVLKKKLTKEEKTKAVVQGLKSPFKWDDITLISDGEFITVKQHQRELGRYSYKELGLPEKKHRNGNGVYYFLGILFLGKSLQNKDKVALLSTNNTNQANKKNLKKILCNAFDTNEDPFMIDEKTNFYKPIFKISEGGDLSVNEYNSGGTLYEEMLQPENND